MENTWKKLLTWLITIGCICHLGPKFASCHNTLISSFPVVGVSPVDFLVCTFVKLQSVALLGKLQDLKG